MNNDYDIAQYDAVVAEVQKLQEEIANLSSSAYSEEAFDILRSQLSACRKELEEAKDKIFAAKEESATYRMQYRTQGLHVDSLTAERDRLAAQIKEADAAQSLLAMQSEALQYAVDFYGSEDFDFRKLDKALSATAETVAAWEAKKLADRTPYAYAGEYSVNDIRDMRTEVFRELSGFKTKTTQPDIIYPLYRGEAL